MRVLHWSHNFYPTKGGGPSHVFDIIKNSINFKSSVITDSLEGHANKLILNDTEIYRFPKFKARNYYFSRYFLVDYIYNMYNEYLKLNQKFSFAKLYDYDIFHYHGVEYSTMLSSLNRNFGFDFSGTFLNFSKINKPKVITLHNHPLNELGYKIYNRQIKDFENIICVDKFIFDYCKVKFRNKKIHFIPNFVNTNKFYFKNKKRNNNRLKIGFAGRIDPYYLDKFKLSISALKKLIKELSDNVNLKMALINNDETKFKHFISKDGPLLSNISDNKFISIAQNLNENEMINFYHEIDLLFAPISTPGISRMALEAMSCGTPVIMLDNEDRTPLVDGVTGFLIDSKNLDIEDKICYFLDNPKLISKFSFNCRKEIINKFSKEIVMPQIENIYSSII